MGRRPNDPYGFTEGMVPEVGLAREKAWRAIHDQKSSGALARLHSGVRDTAELLPGDPNRNSVLSRLERDGFIARYSSEGRHFAELTAAGASVAREIVRERALLERATAALAREKGGDCAANRG